MLLEGGRAHVSLPEGAKCMLGATGRCGNMCRISVIAICPTTAKPKERGELCTTTSLGEVRGLIGLPHLAGDYQ